MFEARRAKVQAECQRLRDAIRMREDALEIAGTYMFREDEIVAPVGGVS